LLIKYYIFLYVAQLVFRALWANQLFARCFCNDLDCYYVWVYWKLFCGRRLQSLILIKFLIVIYKPLKEVSDVGSHNIVISSEHLSVVKCHTRGKSW